MGKQIIISILQEGRQAPPDTCSAGDEIQTEFLLFLDLTFIQVGEAHGIPLIVGKKIYIYIILEFISLTISSENSERSSDRFLDRNIFNCFDCI